MPKINHRENALDTAKPYAIDTRKLGVDRKEALTAPEGCILNMEDWSKGFERGLAEPLDGHQPPWPARAHPRSRPVAFLPTSRRRPT